MKKSSILTIIIFLLVIFPLAVAFVIKPADDFSPEEQRKLQQFPEFNSETLLSGKFSSDINTYMNDQFPLRDFFVGIKGFSEKLLLKGENNGVLRGENGQLAVRLFTADDGDRLTVDTLQTDFYYDNVLVDAANGFQKLNDRLDAKNIPFSLLIPPRTIDVAASAFNYPVEMSDKLTDRMAQLLANVNYIDTVDMFRQRYDAGEYVYYKTDHHWTSLGAYYAYVEVMKSFGADYYELSEFEKYIESEEFYGTTYSKAGYKDIDPDTVTRLELPGFYSSNFITERVKEGITIDGLYDDSKLDEKDKYPYFLGGTAVHIKISLKSEQPREKLLIVGDSFALSLAPMLALHYDIEFVRLSDWRDAAFGDCDRVLVVWNFENIITTTNASGVGSIAGKLGDK